jgi:hypothetical protein
MIVMEQPVKYGIGNGGIADAAMPVFHGQLAGDICRARTLSLGKQTGT